MVLWKVNICKYGEIMFNLFGVLLIFVICIVRFWVMDIGGKLLLVDISVIVYIDCFL